jgi:hypothetical protein
LRHLPLILHDLPERMRQHAFNSISYYGLLGNPQFFLPHAAAASQNPF